MLTSDELKRGEGDGGTKLRGPFKMTRTYEMRKWKRPKREGPQGRDQGVRPKREKFAGDSKLSVTFGVAKGNTWLLLLPKSFILKLVFCKLFPC